MKGVFSTSRRHFVTACQVTGRTVMLALDPPGDCQAANEKKEKNPRWHLWQPPCALAPETPIVSRSRSHVVVFPTPTINFNYNFFSSAVNIPEDI